MNVTFACIQCGGTTRLVYSHELTQLTCQHCEQTHPISAAAAQKSAASEHDGLDRCLVCPSDDLFIRKDFSQRLGITIITIGFIASSIAWYYYYTILSYGILFASALLDITLFFVVGNLLECYRCHTQFRGFQAGEDQAGFDLVIHERERQFEARLQQAASARQGDP